MVEPAISVMSCVVAAVAAAVRTCGGVEHCFETYTVVSVMSCVVVAAVVAAVAVDACCDAAEVRCVEVERNIAIMQGFVVVALYNVLCSLLD